MGLVGTLRFNGGRREAYMFVDEVGCLADGGVNLLVAELPHSAVFVVVVVHYHRVLGALLRVESEQIWNGFVAVEGWAGPGRAVDTLLGPDCQSVGRVHSGGLAEERGVSMYPFKRAAPSYMVPRAGIFVFDAPASGAICWPGS